MSLALLELLPAVRERIGQVLCGPLQCGLRFSALDLNHQHRNVQIRVPGDVLHFLYALIGQKLAEQRLDQGHVGIADLYLYGVLILIKELKLHESAQYYGRL
jgi:hypothetical protein